jgi:ATP-dependent Clp protease ATP-binding subunit ClpC
MYWRFTDRARKAMQLANQEAERFRHDYVGTEHILLGLIAEGRGVAANVLRNLDVDLKQVRDESEKILQFGPEPARKGRLPQTPRGKKVIEYAIEEARALNHNYVGTEHLLLGLLREHDGVAAQVLRNLNLNVHDVRDEVRTLLGQDAPRLDLIGRDLTAAARRGKLGRAVHRRQMVDRVLEVLSRPSLTNPLLLGEAGAGKSSILEDVALAIALEDVREPLRDRRVVTVDEDTKIQGMPSLTALSHRIETIALTDAARSRSLILCIDPLDALILPAGATGSALGLKRALLNGKVRLIATATPARFREVIARDPEWGKLFETIEVEPPSRAELREILRDRPTRHETPNSVQVADDAIEAAIALSTHFTPGRFSREKVIDEAVSLVIARLLAAHPSPDFGAIDTQIERQTLEKETAVGTHDFELAAMLRHQVDELKARKQVMSQAWQEEIQALGGSVDAAVVCEVVCELTGIDAAEIESWITAGPTESDSAGRPS